MCIFGLEWEEGRGDEEKVLRVVCEKGEERFLEEVVSSDVLFFYWIWVLDFWIYFIVIIKSKLFTSVMVS